MLQDFLSSFMESCCSSGKTGDMSSVSRHVCAGVSACVDRCDSLRAAFVHEQDRFDALKPSYAVITHNRDFSQTRNNAEQSDFQNVRPL